MCGSRTIRLQVQTAYSRNTSPNASAAPKAPAATLKRARRLNDRRGRGNRVGRISAPKGSRYSFVFATAIALGGWPTFAPPRTRAGPLTFFHHKRPVSTITGNQAPVGDNGDRPVAGPGGAGCCRWLLETQIVTISRQMSRRQPAAKTMNSGKKERKP